MIPKVIHYCWFGGKPIPKEYMKYIDSWKKYLPDYEIKRWDESNFGIHCNKFVEAAYNAGKYAFVSDFARFQILANRGGYFDTDVEVIRSLDEIIAKGPFLGEQVKGRVAAGLGMAAEPDMEFYKRVVNLYDNMTFDLSQDSNKQVTVVQHVTDLLIECGYDPQFDGIQTICGINIYPPQYFNPQDFKTGVITLTENTYTIHHFAESWKTPIERRLHNMEVVMNRKYGSKGAKLAYIIGLPYWVYKKMKTTGIKGVVATTWKKMRNK